MNSSQIGIVPLNWKYESSRIGEYLSGIAGYGFRGIQISMDQGDSPEFVQSMKDHSLNFAEIYVAVHMTSNGIEAVSETETAKTIALAAKVGVQMVVFAVDGTTERDLCATRASTGPQLTDAAYLELAEHINRFAKISKAHGMNSSFHPHAATFIETFAETEKLMNLLDPQLVGVCLDVGHWIVGGGDPITAIDHFGKRITHIHIKDVSGEALAKLASGEIARMHDSVMDEKLFVPAGTGVLDLKGVIDTLSELNFTGWLMSEQDSAWAPSEAASGISYVSILAALSQRV